MFIAAKIKKILNDCWQHPQQAIDNLPLAYKQKLKNIIPIAATSFLVAASVLAAEHKGLLQSAELNWFDRLVGWKASSQKDPRILIVEITEKDIRQQKQLPLSDLTVARIIQKLQQHQPKVIGLDLYRDIPFAPGTQELNEQLQANNVITITKLGDIEAVPPPPRVPASRVGFNDFVLDADNVVRRNLAYAEYQGEKLYSFALRLSSYYLDERKFPLEAKSSFLQIGDTRFARLNARSGSYQMEESEALGWQFLLDYNREIAETITLTELLEGRFDPELIRGKIVLIGTTAPSQKDLFTTPLSLSSSDRPLTPGVVIHAQMVGQILRTTLDRQPTFWYLQKWQEVILLWGISAIGVGAFRRYSNLYKAGAILLLAASGSLATSGIAFMGALWLPLISSLFALSIGSAVGLVQNAIYLSFHDSLTGLYNRRSFIAKLQRLNRKKGNYSEHAAAIVCLNLDRFKIINESLGNAAGDELLKVASQRLLEGLQNMGKLARISGDEFAIAIVNPQGISSVIQLAEKLQKSLLQPFQLRGQDTFTNVSIGIAFQERGRTLLAEDLLRDAQIAMYKAKASGKARPEVFVQGMYSQALARLRLETDLRKALKNQEFVVYYQPIICFKTGCIAGFEALVRWQSPDRGFVSPGEFIPLAEETGLVIPLGEWVLERACSQMHFWHEQMQNDRLILSVNLSGRQFSQPNLVEKIAEILAETKFHRPSLKLEITESMVMDDVEAAIAILNRLKALDLQLSIDDFGTGFSSFNYLHRFPMDTLKVDKSFVSQMDESEKNIEIVSTIIMLGHKLNMDVVAEGIETESQMQKLRQLGCNYGQGYFFAKPLSSEDTTKLLLENKQW